MKIPVRLRRDMSIKGRKNAYIPDLDIGRTAQEIGIAPAYLSYVISGKRGGSIDTLTKFAEVMNVSVEKLMRYLEQCRVE